MAFGKKIYILEDGLVSFHIFDDFNLKLSNHLLNTTTMIQSNHTRKRGFPKRERFDEKGRKHVACVNDTLNLIEKKMGSIEIIWVDKVETSNANRVCKE